jgi:hypothetical protein
VFGAENLTGNINETYGVEVMTPDFIVQTAIGNGYDAANCVFTAPSDEPWWKYVILTGSSGSTDWQDALYGPEIDAVGWT